MPFLAKSTTVVHTDARTEQKRKQFRTGTPVPRRRLYGVWSAGHIRPKGPDSGIAVMGQAKPMTAIVIASTRKAVKKIRLIDADKLAAHLERRIEYAPTIDPETIPIVRQLREELSMVTAERDAAVSDIETAMAYPNDNCRFCKNANCQSRNGTKPCLPKWRGPQKEE